MKHVYNFLHLLQGTLSCFIVFYCFVFFFPLNELERARSDVNLTGSSTRFSYVNCFIKLVFWSTC